ncbi:uncharacterized protein LOC143859035 [Tasmannia lanceolata]|uniref:uncharacterized protein LOC143859035 n=1 Tax=Tasmannia lanceolata TaxID=3420 RepID=UPI0040628135
MRIIAVAIAWTRCHPSFRFVSAYDLWEGWREVCFSSERANIIVHSWEPPPNGMLKLNFDGACFGNPGLAGVGGLCREDSGKVLWAFCGPIGECNVTEAEVKAAFQGLKTIRRDSLKNLIIEGHSLNVIRWLKGGVVPPWRFLALFDEMEEIIADSNIELNHVWRSANEKEDLLARRGVGSDFLRWFDHLPP